MKTRRMRRNQRNQHNQRGGVKAKPNNDPMNALTRGMGTLRFGTKLKKSQRFGAKTKKHVFAKKSVLKTVKNKNKTKKTSANLRTFITSKLVQRNETALNMEQFEPAEYIRKVGGVMKGLGGVRERIEASGKTRLLDGFDMIISSIYEGLSKIRGAMGKSTNEEMNASDEDIDDILEEIEEVGEELIEQSKEYRKRVKNTSQNVSNIQVQLIGVAEAVNQVLVHSVPKVARANTNQNMSGLLTQLGAMNVKDSSIDDLSELLSGLGV